MRTRFIFALCLSLIFAAVKPIHAQTIATLTYDLPVSGQITRDIFRQIYSFTGHGGDVISLTLTVASGTLDPLLIVTDDQNALIARADDNIKRSSALVQSLNLPHDGSYFVIATRFGQERGSTIGAYTLTLSHAGVVSSTGSDTTTNATSVLHYGDAPVGQIGDAPEQVYAFSAQRGDMITATMQRISGDLDAFLILADAQGNVITTNDDDPNTSGTLDAAIRDWLIRKTGDYLLVATRYGRQAGASQGAFALSLDRVPPDQMGKSAARTVLMDYGASQSGTIDTDTLMHYYQFEAHTGDVITLDAERTRGNLDPTIGLYTASLKLIMNHDQGQRGQSARVSAYTIPTDGVYIVIVSRYDAAAGFTAGDYTLHLIGRHGITVGPRGVLLLSYGGAVSSSVDSAAPNQEYVFEGKAGDVINIDMEATSDDLEPNVLLFDATRHLLTQDDPASSGAQINHFKLTTSGAYVILASRHGRANGKTSGNYLLTLTKETG